MSIQLMPGQRCLLDLLQRKLLKTIQSYARLSLEKQEIGSNEEIEAELSKLKEKIRRISARQKRFTLEIINGNGNNTIPKESFFEALGLVTKEALSKLSSKTNERRRRTTANPRFSHEAIQAKKALEPFLKRSEPRVSRDKREPSARRPQRNKQPNISSNNSNINSTSTSNNATNPNNNDNNSNITTNNGKINTSTNSNKSANRRQLLTQFGDLKRQINTRISQIRDKRESNKKLELIRKDIINAINLISPNPSQGEIEQQSAESLDIWIDMKCDESLDELD